jgi:hypothetical protein
MNQKRNILIYIFEGFADQEVANVLISVNKSNLYNIKTIAKGKVLIKSMAGFSIMPDLDFIPQVDLADIESLNTAMLILPSGNTWKQKHRTEVLLLLNHCIENDIPVAMMENRMLLNVTSNFENDNQPVNTSLNALSKAILNVLHIDMIEVTLDKDDH